MEETVLQNKANDNKKEHKETINVKTFQYIYVVNVIILLIVYIISTKIIHFLDCRFCDESFVTFSEVMKHSKLIHTNNVQHCYNFLENICLYGDDCWFIHSESHQVSEPSFKCKFCEQKFKTKNSESI